MTTTALAPDNKIGHPAEDLLRAALAHGCRELHRLAQKATRRSLQLAALGIFHRQFLDHDEIGELTELFAAILGTAELLGRALIREREQQVLLQHQPEQQQESRPARESVDLPMRTRQSTRFNCGPAALAVVLARWGIVRSQDELAQKLGTTPEDGTRPREIALYATGAGLRAEVAERLTVQDLAHSTARGIPVICNVTMHGGGHYVVVIEASPERITYFDPDDGRYHELGVVAWSNLWHDERGGYRIPRCGIAIAPKGYKASESRQPLPTVKPTRNLLTDAPDIRQPNRYSCGAAASMCAGRSWGVGPETIGEWARELGTNVERSTHPSAIIRYLRSLGLQVEARQRLSIDDLARYTSDGWPVITPVQDYGGELPKSADYDYGHYLTVLKVIDGAVICQDSSIENLEREPGGDVPKRQAEKSGNIAMPGRVLISWQTWLRGWHDQDVDGNKFIQFGIAVGPSRSMEAHRPAVQGRRTLLREAIGLTGVKPMAPQEALTFFRSLLPLLGVDPLRWAGDLRRRAFHLAVATNDEMLQKVQDILAGRLATGQRISDAPKEIEQTLQEMGVEDMPKGYGENVVRTNLMDSFDEGMQHELNQVKETFPAWRYSNPNDSRSRPSHAEKNGKIYPSSVPFTVVRGTDAKDVCLCRCVQIPVDKWTLEELLTNGAKIETSW